MQLVRLTLTDKQSDFADMFVDVFVDDQGSISDRAMSFGQWGSRDNEPWPFCLRSRKNENLGSIDFGAAVADEIERFGTINLYSKTLARGELVTFNHADDIVCFSISKAVVMPSGEDFFLR